MKEIACFHLSFKAKNVYRNHFVKIFENNIITVMSNYGKVL